MTARTPWAAQRTRDAGIARMPMADLPRSEKIGTPLFVIACTVIAIALYVMTGTH